jgi:hypothetical protein
MRDETLKLYRNDQYQNAIRELMGPDVQIHFGPREPAILTLDQLKEGLRQQGVVLTDSQSSVEG